MSKGKKACGFPITALKLDYKGETRRFSAFCSEKGEPEYAKTMDSIAATLKINKENFSIVYKDHDGDLVTIGTTKELRHAFLELPKGSTCLRLDVRPTRKSGNPLLVKKDARATTESSSKFEKGVDPAVRVPKEVYARSDHCIRHAEKPEDKGVTVTADTTTVTIERPWLIGPMKLDGMAKQPLCTLVLYNMCVHHEVFPHTKGPFDYVYVLNAWNTNPEISYYLSSSAVETESCEGIILEEVIDLACSIDHLKKINLPKHMPSEWEFTDKGFSYSSLTHS
jgi:hypothetical protein